MRPLLSIVPVCMNAAATIADTIDSVALQDTDFEVEHILVDGGSNDATRAIIDDRASEIGNLKRIYEPDRGIFDAMNKGLRAAAGEYVFFLNADDFLAARNTLAMALQGIAIDSATNPDLIAGGVAMGTIGRIGVWRHRRVPRLLNRVHGIGLFPTHQGRFVKADLLNAVGGFDAAMRLAADSTQYYDLEQKFRLTIRILPFDIAFMRAGGAANGGFYAMLRGSVEIFRHLRKSRGIVRAASMTFVKTMQSAAEIRFGVCRDERWFARDVRPG